MGRRLDLEAWAAGGGTKKRVCGKLKSKKPKSQIIPSAKTMPFFDLPTDLSISILREWLVDIKSMLVLDIAAARSVRSEFLCLLAQATFVLPAPLVFGAGKSCVDLVHWVNTRMVKLRCVHTSGYDMQYCLKISAVLLAPVSELRILADLRCVFDNDIFQSLLGLLPSLTVVNMSGFTTDTGYLTALASSGLPCQIRRLHSNLR